MPDLSRYDILRCGACSFVFAPDQSGQAADLYSNAYHREKAASDAASFTADEADWRFHARSRLRFVRRHKQRGRLLEIGSAGGFFLDEARTAGFDVTGIEPGREVSEYSRRRFGLDVITGLAGEVEPPGRFESICMWHTLEHIPQPKQLLRSLHDHLAANGLVFVEVPNIESAAARRDGIRWAHLDPEYHLSHFSLRSIEATLELSGFELIETTTLFPWHYCPNKFRPRTAAGIARDAMRYRALRQFHESRGDLLRAVARQR